MSARRLVLAVLAAATCACSVTKSSPAAPSPAGTPGVSLPLTVIVVTRSNEAPIAGATVFKDDHEVGRTDANGSVSASVEPGVQFHITVTAAGYDGNGAWGTVEGPERWTFYLAAQP